MATILEVQKFKETIDKVQLEIGAYDKLETILDASLKEALGIYDYGINVKPMATPRPRSSIMARAGVKANWHKIRLGDLKTVMRNFFVNVYNDPNYMSYKNSIVWELKKLMITRKDYSVLRACFWLPYPKSTPKKDLINGRPHKKKPDTDNYIKGLMDAMEQAGLIKNDGSIAFLSIKKKYTTSPNGYIQFSLG